MKMIQLIGKCVECDEFGAIFFGKMCSGCDERWFQREKNVSKREKKFQSEKNSRKCLKEKEIV